MRSAGPVVEAQLMLEKDLGRGDPISPREWHKLLPFEPAAASDRLGWTGLEAASAPAAPSAELDQPSLTHHTLVLFTRPPDEFELRYEGVKRLWPPPAGAVSVMPAGAPSQWKWRGTGRRSLIADSASKRDSRQCKRQSEQRPKSMSFASAST